MLDRVPPPPLNSTSSLTVLNLTVESTSSFIGAVTMGAGATVASNLGVTGTVTITGVLTAQSSLAVSSATTLTGPVSLGGALSAVSGLSSLAGLNASATAVVSLTVSSAVTFSGLTKVLDQGDFIIQNQADTTKQLEFNLSGQTTGKLLTLSSLLTTSQVLQVPNITTTDTLPTLGLAQTFSAVNTFSNSQDATALGTGALVLSAGGLSVNNQIRLGGALTGSGTITGTQLVSTIATGTAPFTVTSTTVVPNLNVSQLLGQTWANPGAIGGTTPATTFALSGILTSTNTTNASTSLLGAVVIGNGTAATSVALGGGKANIGGTLAAAGACTLDTGANGSSFGGALTVNAALNVGGKTTTSGTLSVSSGLACGNISSSSWTTTGSSTVAAGIWVVLNTNTATIASYTLTMPASPGTGQIVTITSAGIVSTFTLSPNTSQTISNAPTVLAAGVAVQFIYSGTNWYRIQ